MVGPELVRLLPRLRRFSIALMGRKAGDAMLLALLSDLRKCRHLPVNPHLHLSLLRDLVERYLSHAEAKPTEEERSVDFGTASADSAAATIRAMEHALRNILRPEERVAVLLKDLEDLSYVEVAPIMGRNVAQVRSLHFSGREALLSYVSGALAKGA